MKTHTFVVALFAVVLAFAPPFSRTSNADPGRYAAKLISPTAGQVVVAGQQVKVEWKALLPHVDFSWCELEVYLSLDGGVSFPFRLTPQLDPRATFFYWTVPNTPTNAAVWTFALGVKGTTPKATVLRPVPVS